MKLVDAQADKCCHVADMPANRISDPAANKQNLYNIHSA